MSSRHPKSTAYCDFPVIFTTMVWNLKGNCSALFFLESYDNEMAAKSNMFMNIPSNGLTKCVFAITILMNKYSFKKEGIRMPKSQEKCQKIREEARSKILYESMLYFAKNGFAGTKISDLAKHIGIGQGTLYVYFKSKEELFNEIYALANSSEDIKSLRLLMHLPISAKKKIFKLSKNIMDKLAQDEAFAAKVALNTQMMLCLL